LECVVLVKENFVRIESWGCSWLHVEWLLLYYFTVPLLLLLNWVGLSGTHFLIVVVVSKPISHCSWSRWILRVNRSVSRVGFRDLSLLLCESGVGLRACWLLVVERRLTGGETSVLKSATVPKRTSPWEIRRIPLISEVNLTVYVHLFQTGGSCTTPLPSS